MTGPGVLPDHVTDPTGFLLAAADLREKRIGQVALVSSGQWSAGIDGGHYLRDVVADSRTMEVCGTSNAKGASRRLAVHIAAEANPAHARAEVALWRSIAERHQPWQSGRPEDAGWCRQHYALTEYPCPDLLAAVAAARAYLGGQT